MLFPVWGEIKCTGLQEQAYQTEFLLRSDRSFAASEYEQDMEELSDNLKKEETLGKEPRSLFAHLEDWHNCSISFLDWLWATRWDTECSEITITNYVPGIINSMKLKFTTTTLISENWGVFCDVCMYILRLCSSDEDSSDGCLWPLG